MYVMSILVKSYAFRLVFACPSIVFLRGSYTWTSFGFSAECPLDADCFFSREQCYPPVPQAVDTNLRAAALVHTPLVECLNAYAVGKVPEFL